MQRNVNFQQTYKTPYWRSRTDVDNQERDTSHAIVVVGLEQANVYINDLDFVYTPIALEHDEFLAPWQERENRCAVLELTSDG